MTTVKQHIENFRVERYDELVAQVKELKAEVSELRKAKLWVPDAKDLEARKKEAELSKAAVNGDRDAAIAFLKVLADSRKRGRPLACIGDCDKSHALQHELDQLRKP